jgi:hypothetical protein
MNLHRRLAVRQVRQSQFLVVPFPCFSLRSDALLPRDLPLAALTVKIISAMDVRLSQVSGISLLPSSCV